MPGEETSLRDELTAVFDAAEAAQETPAAEVETIEQPSDTPAAESDTTGGEGETQAPAGRPRDAQGRFAPKGDAPADAVAPQAPTDAHGRPGTPPPQQGAPSPAPAQPAAAGLRAPGSWRPELREHWEKVPAQVQAEIHRREQEINNGLRESHQARAAVASIQQVIQPYMANIQAAANGDAVQAIGTLLQADHTLRHGSPSEKAQLAARIINDFGVDLVALDGILAGKAAPNDPQDAIAQRLRAEMQQQLQPVMGYFQQMQAAEQQRQHAVHANAENDVVQFAAQRGNEHFEDVREEMADLMEVAARRGVAMTLKQAYDRALSLDPRFVGEVGKQAERARVTAAAEAAQRAKRAAVSLPSGAAPSGSPGATAPKSVRADIEAAWAAQEGR